MFELSPILHIPSCPSFSLEQTFFFQARQWLLESVFFASASWSLVSQTFFFILSSAVGGKSCVIMTFVVVTVFLLTLYILRDLKLVSLTSASTCFIMWAAWCNRRVLHWFKVRASPVTSRFPTSFSAAYGNNLLRSFPQNIHALNSWTSSSDNKQLTEQTNTPQLTQSFCFHCVGHVTVQSWRLPEHLKAFLQKKQVTIIF